MDRAASAGFEGIAQMLLEQKKLMDALEAENRELRRQIADLRRGDLDEHVVRRVIDIGVAKDQQRAVRCHEFLAQLTRSGLG